MGRIAIICFFALLYSQCKVEPTLSVEFLNGRWKIVQASRDLKKTETLNGAYFIFENKVLTTNYMGSELQTPFELNRKSITQLQPEKIIFEAIIEKNNNLTLQTTIKGTSFSFTMVKE